MLDNKNVLIYRDPHHALDVAQEQYHQADFEAELHNSTSEKHDIKNVVILGMGGSALAPIVIKDWLGQELKLPLEVVRSYNIPGFVNENTLVIASSYSGNTEETLTALHQAKETGAKITIIAAGGELIDYANENNTPHVVLPSGVQPRMALIYSLRANIRILAHYGVVDYKYFDEIAETKDWLKDQTSAWSRETDMKNNYAKQLALSAVGKSGVFYGGDKTAAIAYKWKISWNENAKNTAFYNQYPEFNHNEFMGWTSHPVEKPFAIFDLISSFEHPQVIKRFKVSDKLLSGRRPKARTIELQGDTLLKQLLWAAILADFASIYLAILNNVDPTPVKLIEKLKQELK